VKDVKPGAAIQARTAFVVREGDFVYNRLFAWKGSFAVATASDDGCIVSNEFPCFEVSRHRLDATYLRLYFTKVAAWNEALGLSSGSTPTSRNRLKEDRLLNMKIPLPPLEEQRRIVARVEAIAAKVEEAQRLRRMAEAESQSVLRSMLFNAPRSELTPLRELLELREPDVRVDSTSTYQFAGVYSFGRGVFVGDAKQGLTISYPRLTRLRTGDFVYPKLMAWEGAFAVVPPEANGCVVSTEFPVFRIRTERVLPELVDTYFKTPAVWEALAGGATGTNVRRRRLHPEKLLATCLPVPPMADQLRLSEVSRLLAGRRSIQATSTVEWDRLLPTVLDRAFRGEL
jgi:type I restriction enzyme S subunit